MTPPITPAFVYGRTIFLTTSQVVHPIPYADSLRTGGTISKTSRMTEAINGRIIKASIKPAQSIPLPFGGPENKIPIRGI